MLKRVVGALVTVASLGALIVAVGARPAQAESRGPVLQAGGVLRAGDQMWSTEGGFAVVMQGDGNLVLYAPGSRPLWASGTAGHPGAWAQMQGDGNFVVYEPGPRALWSTRTDGHPGAWIQIQPDGNFVAYEPGPRALWSSGTARSVTQPATRCVTYTNHDNGVFDFRVVTEVCRRNNRIVSAQSRPKGGISWAQQIGGWSYEGTMPESYSTFYTYKGVRNGGYKTYAKAHFQICVPFAPLCTHHYPEVWTFVHYDGTVHMIA